MHYAQPPEDYTPAQQPNKDQDEHDKWLLAQSSQELDLLAANLANLARSKVGNADTSSTPAPSRGSGSAEVGSFSDEDIEMAKALGF
jgi:hypothetical protein